MIRSLLVIGGTVVDVTLALRQAAAPEPGNALGWIALGGALAGCVALSAGISRRLVGLELVDGRRGDEA